MTTRILAICGHPDGQSFCHALLDAYCNGAQSTGADVRVLKLSQLNFDPILWHGYRKEQALEDDLVKAQELIQWAQHLVFVYPIWWGAMPALMKGFFDRVMLPDFAFRFGESPNHWEKLLKGRTAELLVTMDTPPWYYYWFFRSPGHNEMKRTILEFCGIKVMTINEFAPVKTASAQRRDQWLLKAASLGRQCQHYHRHKKELPAT